MPKGETPDALSAGYSDPYEMATKPYWWYSKRYSKKY